SHSYIRSRLADAITACNIQIDIVLAETNAAMRFENGKDHGKSPAVPADDRATRGAERGGRDKRLNFHQHWARALHTGEDGGAGSLGIALAEKKLRRIGHFAQAAIRHFENADFVGRAEAVLHCSQNAV